jgi:glycosyltransferase involved in cell wall biosynthesis
MVVSAPADAKFRREVSEGTRPRPDYLGLESEGVELLDWSRLEPPLKGRSWLGSLRHARRALGRLESFDVVFSDGEPVGVPLALGMMARGIKIPHLMLGHRLTTLHKRPFFTALKSHRAMTRILVHSARQLDDVPRVLGIPAGKVALVSYYADGSFWKPRRVSERRLVVSAGREQRDYETLVRASSQSEIEVVIADGSVHSPRAQHRGPDQLPPHVQAGFADYVRLRDLYAQAAVVAVPLVENDFQAGVTTILEAMAMGKAVVVSATSGQKDVVEDGVTGMTVPPADAGRLGEAIRFLLDHPRERKRLGHNARAAFEERFTLDRYVAVLLGHMREIAAVPPHEFAIQREKRAAT